jgi:GAF domain-containing protein
MESSSPSRVHASSATAASASTNLPSNLPASNPHFPAQGGEQSLADMARRDLDAALQLLADRAQYITGASGAAIALRRHGKKDMLCRASTGANAPALGALLSAEFGLSGESVRTRQPLRCDDAERDARVNREVCRQLGIASVVVMPVVNDDEVLGVFELFSGEVNAFGERDLSAVQRLSEMVETAVRLAEAAENLPERLRAKEISAPADVEQDKVLGGQVLEEFAPAGPIPGEPVAEELILEDAVLHEPKPEPEPKPGRVLEVAGEARLVASKTEALVENIQAAAPDAFKEKTPGTATNLGQPLSQAADENQATTVEGKAAASPESPKDSVAQSTVAIPPVASPSAEPVAMPSVETAPSKKQLFWSAALDPAADAGGPQEADQTHIPLVLRRLRKCEACGFPVSAGRVLCVECEEKKWRGQLRVPKAGARAFAAAAQSVAGTVPPTAAQVVSATSSGTPFSPAAQRKEFKPAGHQVIPPAPAADPPRQKVSEPSAQPSEGLSSDFAFSAGLEPSQSWLSANKYVIGVLLVVAVAVAAFVFFR